MARDRSSSMALLGAIASLAVVAACGRSIPRDFTFSAASNDSGNGVPTGFDGSTIFDGATFGPDGEILFPDATPPAIDASVFDAGAPDSGDPCAELAACCAMISGPGQQQCEQAAMSGNPMICQGALNLAQRVGFCGGRPRRDGGMGMMDGGRRRRDAGVFDGGSFDAGPLGPECSALVQCCMNVPARLEMQCIGAADMGNESACMMIIGLLNQVGLTCDAADGG
jgi:hypothetical protein